MSYLREPNREGRFSTAKGIEAGDGTWSFNFHLQESGCPTAPSAGYFIAAVVIRWD